MFSQLEAKNFVEVTNNTLDPICIAFVKTDIPSKASLITGKDRHRVLYVNPDDKIYVEFKATALLPGDTYKFDEIIREFRELGTYDRTLWVIPNVVGNNDCANLFRDLSLDNKKMPKGTQPFEIGSKDRVFVVPASGDKYALKSSSKKLED